MRVLMLLWALALFIHAQDPFQRSVVSVERIWDRAPHSAFTDIARFEGRLWIAFREGTRHVYGVDGTSRVIASDDGENWRAVARFSETGIDLRDPKLSVTPEGRLMIVMGGSRYEGRRFLDRRSRVAFLTGEGVSPLTKVEVDPSVRTDEDWLWRVTWRGETGYGVVYSTAGSETTVHLVSTVDGVRYRKVAKLAVTGRPGEATLRFRKDGTMLCVIRRERDDRNAWMGEASTPYRSWTWRSLGVRIGGPNLVVLPDGSEIVGGRRYAEGGSKTALWRIPPRAAAVHLLDLPSGGDTSYPGFLVDDDELLVSYYSSHETKASIWLARLRWRELVVGR